MRNRLIGLLIFIFSFSASNAQMKIHRGLVITKSIRFKKANYNVSAPDSLNQPVIVVEGNNLVVDFNGTILMGTFQNQRPDRFCGLAIFVRNGKNITIKNLTAKGYKIAVRASNVDGLRIENCDFSYNYRQHLNSTQEKEDMSDWLTHHQNESDEWLRYGAAMYLRQCSNAVISNCRVTGGQNALMMMECHNGIVYNNDFSFNSGLGIGMYKSSGNRISYNKLDFNVRGYSHDVYSRGQDSAGILIYEQSNDNLFYNNSVTHSGDGFFLWAGQTTMDTGTGGCNGNRVVNNDFSYAPTNGVEVTFSSNQITGNRIFECDNGIWGGYSYHTTISANQFRNNKVAIAIEHGQHNKIEGNIFYRDKEAIRLWSKTKPPLDWGYAKHHDTRSADYIIALNSFNLNPVAYDLAGTDSLRIFKNRYSLVGTVFQTDSGVSNIDSVEMELTDTTSTFPTVKNPINPFKGNAKLAGRKNIMITEWGPYDFRYPLIWNTNPTDTSYQMAFDVLGPEGSWRIISASGIGGFDTRGDSLPGHFKGTRLPHQKVDIEITAEYAGPSFTDQFGNRIPANTPYHFVFKKFFQPIDFTVKFYPFDSSDNPIKTKSIERLLKQEPFKTEQLSQLNYAWWGGINAGKKQYTQFLTVAEGSADMESGLYELGVTWDDAIRVYLDDKLIVDEWDPSRYQFDESPNRKLTINMSQGIHKFRVEHVELGGLATLRLKLGKR